MLLSVIAFYFLRNKTGKGRGHVIRNLLLKENEMVIVELN